MIVPGKMIVLVRAAGIRVIGITRWQNGTSHRMIFSWLRDMLPRTSNMWEMKETTKSREKVMNAIARYRSILPVWIIKKNRTLKKR